MGKSEHQKLKILNVMNMFFEKTDESHGITMEDIQHELQLKGIASERKSIYDDISELKYYGLDIKSYQQDGHFYYNLVSRDFEIAELKLLVDIVESSRFITAAKSDRLIKNLEGLASIYDAKELNRDVVVANRVKTMNESIYFSVDAIQEAMKNNRKIRFRYFQWTAEKKMSWHRDGEYYSVSPWTLNWNDGNYYLVGYEDRDGALRHFRIDRMKDIGILDEKREGKSLFSSIDPAIYEKQLFGMFSGELMDVKMEFPDSLAGVVIDRFGKDTIFVPSKRRKGFFNINVRVNVSRQFYGWLFGLGPDARILAPKEAAEGMREAAEAIVKQYSL